jgi:hypothetical protein
MDTNTLPHDENGRIIVTRAEWNAKHSDFKLTAKQSMSGVPMMMFYDDKHGTILAPVTIR